MSVHELANAGMIAAVYTVLTLAAAPVSYGPVQFRISEALCILPVFTSSAIPGLFAGCILANLLGTAMPVDVIFGSIATLIGAFGTYQLRNKGWLSALPPIISNAVIVPFVLRFAYGTDKLIPVMMLTVGAGEILAVGVCGNLLRMALKKHAGHIFGRDTV